MNGPELNFGNIFHAALSIAALNAVGFWWGAEDTKERLEKTDAVTPFGTALRAGVLVFIALVALQLLVLGMGVAFGLRP